MAATTHENLAADAAAYLAKSARTIQSISEATAEIERQANCLVEWARQRNVVLTENYFAGLEKYSVATAEHEVFYHASDNRAIKRTYAGTFGVTNQPKGEQRHATPLFYLRRLELMNRVFNSDLRLEGIIFGKSLIIGVCDQKPCAVISQPWIDAADENNPHPTENEIFGFLESLGFVPVRNSYFGWIRQNEHIFVGDARRDNFIKTANGVVPIDLVISEI